MLFRSFLPAEQPERPCNQERFAIGALTVEYDETSKIARRARIAETRRFRNACIIDRVREDANAHEFRSSTAAIGEEADREPCDRHRPRIMMFPDERRGLAPGIDYIDGQGCGVDFRSARHPAAPALAPLLRSEEHTSELQSLMRISYAVFCLKKQK